MSEIFISHATADKDLVKSLVSLLRDGMGVPKKSIFCTSLKGYGIPLGKDFSEYMKSKIQEPKIVIMLITPAYLESQFCLMETGAVWSKSLHSCPIVVPPVGFASITKTLGLVQSWTINDESGIVDFKTAVVTALKSHVTLEDKDEHDWMDAREEWIDALPKLLKQLSKASMVTAKDHKQLKDRFKIQKRKNSDLEEELNKKEALITALRAAKNKEDVASIDNQYEDEEAEFEALLDALNSAKPENTYRVIFLHFLMDYYEKAPAFDWYNCREELQAALDYNLISADGDGTEVNWKEPQMQKLHKAIGAVDEFACSSDGKKYLENLQEEVTVTPSNKAFWEYHLDL